MARRKDLAGIAALAGLGMLMANKGKKGSTSERQIAADKDANETQSMEDDSGMDPEEAANKRTERMLKPNERGAPGTSETVFPSSKPDGGRAAAKPASKPVAKPITGTGNQRGPTAEELAAYKPPSSSKYPDIRGSTADNVNANLRKNIREGSQAVEGVYPESNLAAPGLRAAQSAIKGIAGRFGGDSAKKSAPFLKELPYSGTKQLPNAPTKMPTEGIESGKPSTPCCPETYYSCFTPPALVPQSIFSILKTTVSKPTVTETIPPSASAPCLLSYITMPPQISTSIVFSLPHLTGSTASYSKIGRAIAYTAAEIRSVIANNVSATADQEGHQHQHLAQAVPLL